MTSLDRLIPVPRLVEIDRIDLGAPAEKVWDLVRHGDLARSPFIRALFTLRALPARLAGRPAEPSTIRIDDLVSTAERPGFQVLVDHPVDEFAVGAIGKVWQGEIPFLHVADEDAFLAFDDEGFVKVAWAIRVSPRGERGSHVEVEVRVDATDDESWKKFRRYFTFIGPGSRFIRHSLLHGLARDLGGPEAREDERVLAGDAARAGGRLPRDDWGNVLRGTGGAAIMTAALLTPFLRQARGHWGLDVATAERAYPGDELILQPRWQWTHGVEIAAPAADVWPWVAQVGANRGGFYSYQWLENLAGCNLRNAEAIHPEWEVREGDELVLHPGAPPLPVVSLARGRYFVAHAPADAQARASGKPWVEATWLFWVEPLGQGRCRFISRYRANSSDDLFTRLSFGPALIEPVGFAMDRRMLLGVKERAERAVRTNAPLPPFGDSSRVES